MIFTSLAVSIPGMKKKKNPSAVALGKLGGAARSKALTPARRREIARQAVAARWARKKGKVPA